MYNNSCTFLLVEFSITTDITSTNVFMCLHLSVIEQVQFFGWMTSVLTDWTELCGLYLEMELLSKTKSLNATLRPISFSPVVSQAFSRLVPPHPSLSSSCFQSAPFPLFPSFLVPFLLPLHLNHFRPRCSGGRTAAGAWTQEAGPLIPPFFSPWLSAFPPDTRAV